MTTNEETAADALISTDDFLDAYEAVEQMTTTASWPALLVRVVGNRPSTPECFKAFVTSRAGLLSW